VTKQVVRHQIDLGLAKEHQAAEGKYLPRALERARLDPIALDLLISRGYTYACATAAVEPTSPEIWRGLKLAAEGAAAMFTAAAGTGDVEMRLGDAAPGRVQATGPTGGASIVNWLHGYHFAVICRDERSLGVLAATPLDIIRRSTTKADECVYLYIGALQAWLKREPGVGEMLLAAVEATDPVRLGISSEEYILNILVPEMEVVYRLMLGDAPAFNETLVFALERHKKYWSKGTRKMDPSGYISLGLLAAAAQAHDDGLALDVVSDYLPPMLVAGMNMPERSR
jgi:hypothetical protein